MKEISATKLETKNFAFWLFGFAILLAGCDSLRFAPSEQQKQNAWLHNRTAIAAAETARAESASEKLQVLSGLSELQSQAFTSYFGLPSEFPQAGNAEQILAESNWQLANTAVQQSSDRPDAWQVAGFGDGAGNWYLRSAGRRVWHKGRWVLKGCEGKVEGPAGDYYRQRAFQKE
jgi:hypothetical protein